MFLYTRAAFNKIIKDVRMLGKILDIIFPIFYTAYLVYATLADIGFLIPNIILLAASALYLVFYIFVFSNTTRQNKRKKSQTKHTYTRVKIVINGFTLALTLYGFYISTINEISPLAIIFSTLLLIMWLISLCAEAIGSYFEFASHLVIEGLSADFDVVTKATNAVGNMFRKAKGEEPEEPQEPTRERKYLDERVLEVKENRNREVREVINSVQKKLFGIKEKMTNREKKSETDDNQSKESISATKD